MIQEYLIKDEKTINSIRDYSNDEIKQKIIKKNKFSILLIDIKGNNEISAKKLSEVHEEITLKNQLVVLNDGCSEYFNKSLFPLINEFEIKLRKLLYLSASLADSDDIKGIENIKDLEKQDLGTIFEMLFTDGEFNKITRQLGKNLSWQYNKKWLIQYIDGIDEKTLWSELLGNNIEDLSNKYLEVKDARNAVMYAHDINYFTFNKTRKLFRKINDDIDSLISEIISSDCNRLNIFNDFNHQLSEALKQQSKIISDTIKPLVDNLDSLQSIFSKIDIQRNTEGIKRILDENSDFMEKLSLLGSERKFNNSEVDSDINNES